MRGKALLPHPALVGVPKIPAPTGIKKNIVMFLKKLHNRVFIEEGKWTSKSSLNIFSYLWN